MRIGGLVGFCFMGLPLLAPVIGLIVKNDFDTVVALAGYGGLLASLAVLGWWFGGLRWRHAGVRLDGRGIAIRKGVFFRSETFVPHSRIQHTDIHRGPMDRWLGLSSLKLHTAGTRLASIDIAGLDADRALELRDALVSDADDTV